MRKSLNHILLTLLVCLLVACRSEPENPAAQTNTGPTAQAALPTVTSIPPSATPPPTLTPVDTATWTAVPTATWTAAPTDTPEPTSTAIPTPGPLTLTIIHTNDTFGETDPCG